MSKQTEGSAVRRFASVIVILAMLLQSFSVPAFAQDNDSALGEGDEVLSGSAVDTVDAKPAADEDDSILDSILELLSGGNPLSREEIVSSFGFATEFAVFAIDFVNDNHMEGAVAVKNLNGAYSNIGNTGAVYQYAPDFDVTIKKSVDGSCKEGTFKFGFFVKDGDSYTLADGLDYVYVTTDENGQGSTTITSDRFGRDKVYYVFEIDDNGEPIIEGEGVSGGKSYEVTYNSNGINGASYVSSVGNTSYVEYFRQPGCEGAEVFQSNGIMNPTVVIGETNTVEPYNNGSDVSKEYIVGEDGSRYLIKSGDTIVNKVEGSFPIDFEAEFDRLSDVSADLAQAVSTDDVKVVNIPVSEGGYEMWDNSAFVRSLDLSKVVCDGELLDENTVKNSGLTTDDKLLVINVDCSNANPTDRITVDRININGKNPASWDTVARDVVWNFYTVKDGEYEPFTGTLNNYELFGTMLAPRAEIICGASTNGSVIASKVSHGGCEIHHIPPMPKPGNIVRTVYVSNKSDENGTTKETTTEATTETTTAATTEETTEATTVAITTVATTEDTTEETTTEATTTEATTEETTEATTVAITTVATTEDTTEETTTEATTVEITTVPGDDSKPTTTEATTAAPTTVATTEATTEETTEATTVVITTVAITEATTEETTEATTVAITTVATTEDTTEETTETTTVAVTTVATTEETTTEATTVEITTVPGDDSKPTTTEATTEATTAAPTTVATTEATTEETTEATTVAITTVATTEDTTEETTTEATTVEITTKPDGSSHKETTTEATTVEITTVATTEATTAVPTTEATTEVTTAAPTTVAPTTEATTEATTVEITTKPGGGNSHKETTTKAPTTETTTEATTVEITTVAPTTEATTEATTVEMTTRTPSGGGGSSEPETEEVTVEESSSEVTSEGTTEVLSETTTASIEATTETTTAIEASSETTTASSDTPDNPGTPGTPGGGRGPNNPGGNTPSGNTPGTPSGDEPGGSSGFSFDRPRSAANAPDGAATVSLRRPHSAITPAEDVPTTTVSRVIKPKAASGASLPKTGDTAANGFAVMLMLLAGAAFMFTFKRTKK